MGAHKLQIASLWSGEPVPTSERASVVVTVGSGTLTMLVDAPFHGDPRPTGLPGSTEGLWDYEVVELFVAGAGNAYVELELGPHGHYLALSFSAPRVRRGGPFCADASAAQKGGRWRGELSIETSLMPFEPTRVNAYAIHGPADARRYLAAHAPGGERPDFHRLESFESFPWLLGTRREDAIPGEQSS